MYKRANPGEVIARSDAKLILKTRAQSQPCALESSLLLLERLFMHFVFQNHQGSLVDPDLDAIDRT